MGSNPLFDIYLKYLFKDEVLKMKRFHSVKDLLQNDQVLKSNWGKWRAKRLGLDAVPCLFGY